MLTLSLVAWRRLFSEHFGGVDHGYRRVDVLHGRKPFDCVFDGLLFLARPVQLALDGDSPLLVHYDQVGAATAYLYLRVDVKSS